MNLPKQVGAVLFDMDNTLVNSEQAWFEAAVELWGHRRIEAKVQLGGTVESVVAAYLADHPHAEAAAVAARYRDLLEVHLPRVVEPMPGAVELLTSLHRRMPMTIASNSPSQIVGWVVAALSWDDYFTATLGTEDVTNPKPAPDLYLAAAAACAADPTTCVVFEDSLVGVRAATAAGTFVVTVGAAANGMGDASVQSLAELSDWRPEVIR